MQSIHHYITIIALVLLPLIALAQGVPIEQMKASTVRVVCNQGGSVIGTGSGFVVGDGKHIVTNHHVATCGGKVADLTVILGRDSKPDARVLWSSEDKDLAVLAINATGTPIIGFALSTSVQDAEAVYAMGFPGAADYVSDSDGLYDVKISKGIISARTTLINGLRVYQTDAAINPGNSGGPLFDESGRVVGVNVAQNRKAKEGINYSIQADTLIPELERLGISFHKDGNSVQPNVPVSPPSSPSLIPVSKNTTFPWIYFALIIAVGLGAVAVILSTRGKNPNRSRDVSQVFFDGQPPKNIPPAGSRPLLLGVSGAFAGNEIRLGSETISIGRDPQQCQLVFPKETEGVGRLHCAVRFDEARKAFILTDKNSTNGTFTGNGERLLPGSSAQIGHGGRFHLATSRNLFEVRLV